MPTEQLKDQVSSKQEHNPGAETASVIVDLGAKIDHVEKAFLMPGQLNPVTALQELDQAYERAGASADDFAITTAMRLLQQIDTLFKNMHYHSSLLGRGSKFFAAVLKKMGTMILAQKKEEPLTSNERLVLIRLVEIYRRENNETEMVTLASRVTGELKEGIAAKNPNALVKGGKVTYEEGMHFLNNAKDFEGARSKGRTSEALCREAGDDFGEFCARDNIICASKYTEASLLTDPKDADRRRQLLDEALTVLREDLEIVQERLSTVGNDTERRRNLERVVMNTSAHIIEVTDLQENDILKIKTMGILKENPVFRTAVEAEEKWALEYLEKIEALREATDTRA